MDPLYHEQYVAKFGSYRLITGPTRGVLMFVLRVLLENIVKNDPTSKLGEFAKKLLNDNFIKKFDDSMLEIIKNVGQSPEKYRASYKVLKCQQGTGEQGIVSLWYIKNVKHSKGFLETNTLCMSDANMMEIFHLLWKRFNSLCAMLDPERSYVPDLTWGVADPEILDSLIELRQELESHLTDVKKFMPSPIDDSFNSPPASPCPPMPGAPRKPRHHESKMNYVAAAKGESSRTAQKKEESNLIPMDSVIPDDAKEIDIDKVIQSFRMSRANAEDLPRVQKKAQPKKITVVKESKVPKPTNETTPEFELRPFVTIDDNGKMVIVNAVFSKEALAKMK